MSVGHWRLMVLGSRLSVDRWRGLLEDAVVWPRRIMRAFLVVSLIIVAVLVAYYMETGNRAVIPAIVVLVASIPIDVVLLKAALEATLSSNAVEVARVLEEAGAGVYRSRPVFNGVLVASQVGDGQVHVLLKTGMIQAVYLEDPNTLPMQGGFKPGIKAPIRPPRSARKCVTRSIESVIEVTSLDPSTGIPIMARGSGKYAFKTCPNSLNPRDVREILGLVLS